MIAEFIQEIREKNRLEREKLNMAKEIETLRVSYSNVAWLILEVLDSLGVAKMLDQVADMALFQYCTNTTLYYAFNVGAISFYEFKKRFEMFLLNNGHNPQNIKIKRVGNMLKVEMIG